MLTAGGGVFAQARIFETEGVFLGDHVSVENVRDAFGKISDEVGQAAYFAGGEQTQKFFRKITAG